MQEWKLNYVEEIGYITYLGQNWKHKAWCHPSANMKKKGHAKMEFYNSIDPYN